MKNNLPPARLFEIFLTINCAWPYGFTAQVLKVCRTPGSTSCSKTKMFTRVCNTYILGYVRIDSYLEISGVLFLSHAMFILHACHPHSKL